MKRDPRLHGLSADHHHALVLARRLSQTTSLTASEAADLRAVFDRELEPHFRAEEELLLPPLRTKGEAKLVERTLADHAALRAAIQAAAGGDATAARDLGTRLGDHVRFEERDLFPACERQLSDAELAAVVHRVPHPRDR